MAALLLCGVKPRQTARAYNLGYKIRFNRGLVVAEHTDDRRLVNIFKVFYQLLKGVIARLYKGQIFIRFGIRL